MLTRLKVSGFKNLVDVDVHFGPFTCIAGPNGAGKSNLFDAIRFLSLLSDRSLMDAALCVRDEGSRTGDIKSLFHRIGDTYDERMSFEAEMIVPHEALDDLGQRARSSITFLRYSLVLCWKPAQDRISSGSLEILKEELSYIRQGDAGKRILFDHSATKWRKSAVKGRRTVPYFISTSDSGANRVIKLHQDKGTGGRALARAAVNLPRTVLSAANAAESPTALVARREMQSWQLLQLEPSALRPPNEFAASHHIGTDGSHLAATLYHLAQSGRIKSADTELHEVAEQRVYGQVAGRLAELVDDVYELWVERDDKRELLTLYVRNRDGTPHPTMSLSDGTLRFLALAVIEMDPQAQGLLCLEEPENGIHPQRIPAMLRLLQDVASDVYEPIGPENPLRQVIVNTHSPAVVSQVPDDSLLIAELKETVQSGKRFKRACFSCLKDTWRDKKIKGTSIVSRGKLMSYLNPARAEDEPFDTVKTQGRPAVRRYRVADRPDLQLSLPFN